METTTKICKVCGRELPEDEFVKNACGVTSVCKECHSKKIKEGVENRKKLKQQAVDAVNARSLRLQDFTPRELMEELAKRGYAGTLTYTKVEKIDLSNL